MNSNQKRDVAISVKYLIIVSSILLAGVIGAFALKLTGLEFLPCGFYEITGWYCLTCGVTRATLALTQFKILRSILFNPFPMMIVTYLLTVIVFEVVCIIRKKRVVVQWLPWTVIVMLFILTAFFFLRNTGVIPMPV